MEAVRFYLQETPPPTALRCLGSVRANQPVTRLLLNRILTSVFPVLDASTFTLHHKSTDSAGELLADGPQTSDEPIMNLVVLVPTGTNVGRAMGGHPLWSPISRSTTPVSSSSTSSSTPLHTPTDTSTPAVPTPAAVNQIVTTDFKRLRADLQTKLTTICYVRDRGCCITSDPMSNRIECAHVMTPEFAVSLITNNDDFERFLSNEPSVQKRDGTTQYSVGYDVVNAFMLERQLHNDWNAFRWSILDDGSGAFRAFRFQAAAAVEQNALVRTPSLIDLRFPPVAFFREHFKEAARRNFRAAGEFQPLPDEPGAGGAAEVLAEEWQSDDEHTGPMELIDKMLLRIRDS